MFTILLHSSKTMKTVSAKHGDGDLLINEKATRLIDYVKSLSASQIQSAMQVSEKLAGEIYTKIHHDTENGALPAIDIFLGDIYSGLQAQTFSAEDRTYAHEHLFILSGLYGVVRALDAVRPYRLEMGYKLPGNKHDRSQPDITSLYTFWGDTIACRLPKNQAVINLSAKEYTKAVFPYFKTIDGLKDVKIISPKFLTISSKTNEPTFVTVHAKVARGAFARWLLLNRIEDITKLQDFNEIGYQFNRELSTPDEPVFVAKEFKGIGLSVRLSK